MTFMSRKTASADVRSKLQPQQTSGAAAGATAQVHHKRAESAWTMTSLKKKQDTTKGKAVDKPVTVPPGSFEKAPNPMNTALKAPAARQFEIIAPRASPTAAVFESEQVELPSVPRVKPKGLPKVRLVPPVEDTSDSRTLYSASTSPAPSPGMGGSRTHGGRSFQHQVGASQPTGRSSSPLARASVTSTGPMALSSPPPSGARTRSRPPSIAPSRSGSKDQWLGMSGQFNYPPPTFNRTSGFPGMPIVMPKTKREVQVEMRRRSFNSLASADSERRRRSAAAARSASGPVTPATPISKTLPELPPGFAASRAAAAASQNKTPERPILRRPPSLNLVAARTDDDSPAPFTVVPLNDASSTTPVGWRPAEPTPHSAAAAPPPITPKANRSPGRTKSVSPPRNKELPAPPVVRKQRSLKAFFFGRKVMPDGTASGDGKTAVDKGRKPALQITMPSKPDEPEQLSSTSSRTCLASREGSPDEQTGTRSASQTPKTSTTSRSGFFALHKRHLSLSNLAGMRKGQATEGQRPPMPPRAASDLSLLKKEAAKGEMGTAAPALKKPVTVSPLLSAVPFLNVPEARSTEEAPAVAVATPRAVEASNPPKQYLGATATVSPFALALPVVPDPLSMAQDLALKSGLSPSATHLSLRSSASRDTASRASERWSEEGHSIVDEDQCELVAATSRRLSREIFAQPSILSMFSRPSRMSLRAARDRSSLRPASKLMPSHPSISSLASSASSDAEVAANTSIMRAMLKQILLVSSSGLDDGPDGQTSRVARASTVTLAPMRKPLLIDLSQMTLTRRSKSTGKDIVPDAIPALQAAVVAGSDGQEGDTQRDVEEDEVAASDESVITDLTTTSSSEGHTSLETPTATSALNPLIVASASESDHSSSEDHVTTTGKTRGEHGGLSILTA